MENLNDGNNNINYYDNYENHDEKLLLNFLNLVRNNYLLILIVIAFSTAAASYYAFEHPDIYSAKTTIKISKPNENILESPIMPDFQNNGNQIANEIEIIKSNSVRSRTAKAIFDSLENDRSKFSSIINTDLTFNLSKKRLLTITEAAKLLTSNIGVSQKENLDIVEISAESTSPVGAALMANVYANEYRKLNLEQNRERFTIVKNFLKEQRDEKLTELKDAESLMSEYQEKGGIISLDAQASSLVGQLAGYEAQKNTTQIELIASNKVLNSLKNELANRDPRLASYLESVSSEVYYKSLQEQIVKIEVAKDLAVSDSKPHDNNVIKEYDQKIAELKKKLNEKIEGIKAGVFSSSPEEVKELSQKILQEENNNQSLRSSLNEYSSLVNRYDAQFNKLPKTSIELARFQRSRESLEKLYVLVEGKYQEALINEQSEPGNVMIIDQAEIPFSPSSPNRLRIVIIGFIIGFGFSFMYVFIKNYFDNTVKTPEDIKKKKINVLAWIPQMDIAKTRKNEEIQFVILRDSTSTSSEAFRALRTMIQFSKLEKDAFKSFLVTSSIAGEGKTTISTNLAGCFAQSNKKTLLVDADLRKPKVHRIFSSARSPGLTEALFGHSELENIIHQSEIPNLDYITAGTIPSNPSELLNSVNMKNFLAYVRELYDIVIIDSAPVVAVTDSVILSRLVDASLLVISSEKTPTELMEKSVELIKNDSSSFLGTVLNNFSYKAGYGAYYKYYYYYYSQSHSPNNSPKSKFSEKKIKQ